MGGSNRSFLTRKEGEIDQGLKGEERRKEKGHNQRNRISGFNIN